MRRRILLAGLDRDAAEDLARGLAANGHDAVWAPDGRAALHELVRGGIGAAVLHADLAGLGCATLLRAIRESATHEVAADMPVFVALPAPDEPAGHAAPTGGTDPSGGTAPSGGNGPTGGNDSSFPDFPALGADSVLGVTGRAAPDLRALLRALERAASGPGTSPDASSESFPGPVPAAPAASPDPASVEDAGWRLRTGEELLEGFGLGPEDTRMLAARVLEEAPPVLRTLGAAARDGDARATAKAAHWLAGSVLSILVQGLAELARGLETDLLGQACTTADERCARLARGTRAALDLLARRYA